MTSGRLPIKINSRSLLYWWRAGESRADLCKRFGCGETTIWRTIGRLREKLGTAAVPYRRSDAVFGETTCVKCQTPITFYVHAVEPKYCVDCSPMANMRRAALERSKRVQALRAEGLTQKAIAERMGVSVASIVTFCRRQPTLNTGHTQPVGDAHGSAHMTAAVASSRDDAARPSAAGIRGGVVTNNPMPDDAPRVSRGAATSMRGRCVVPVPRAFPEPTP